MGACDRAGGDCERDVVATVEPHNGCRRRGRLDSDGRRQKELGSELVAEPFLVSAVRNAPLEPVCCAGKEQSVADLVGDAEADTMMNDFSTKRSAHGAPSTGRLWVDKKLEMVAPRH
jgi:hypothetical protein